MLPFHVLHSFYHQILGHDLTGIDDNATVTATVLQWRRLLCACEELGRLHGQDALVQLALLTYATPPRILPLYARKQVIQALNTAFALHAHGYDKVSAQSCRIPAHRIRQACESAFLSGTGGWVISQQGPV